MNKEFVISQSPGRINIIGEHTDYNDGFVLPAAIDKKSVFKLKRNGSNLVTLTAKNVGETYTFDLFDFKPISNGWQNYAMGVVNELQKLGGKIEGFEGEFEGDVPIGSGMSSSAALECSLAFGLNELFDLDLDKWQLIKASQMAEHHFVGTKCGIMDQFASIMGKRNNVMLLDCKSLEFQYFPFELGDYQILLLNTNVSHNLASSEYNTRRASCEKGISIIQHKFQNVQSFRDVSLETLNQCISDLPEKIYRRCHHVISENARVLKATEALLAKNFHALGQLMYGSHYSLQKDYEVSCAELDFLVKQTEDKDYILGSRMMGGGFGGCTINLVKKNRVNHFIELASENYRKQFGVDLTPYTVSIGNGAELVT